MEKNDYPLMPMILAFVLGPMFEEYCRRTISYYGSFASALATPSIGTCLVVLGISMTVWGFLREIPYVKKCLEENSSRKKDNSRGQRRSLK